VDIGDENIAVCLTVGHTVQQSSSVCWSRKRHYEPPQIPPSVCHITLQFHADGLCSIFCMSDSFQQHLVDFLIKDL